MFFFLILDIFNVHIYANIQLYIGSGDGESIHDYVQSDGLVQEKNNRRSESRQKRATQECLLDIRHHMPGGVTAQCALSHLLRRALEAGAQRQPIRERLPRDQRANTWLLSLSGHLLFGLSLGRLHIRAVFDFIHHEFVDHQKNHETLQQSTSFIAEHSRVS